MEKKNEKFDFSKLNKTVHLTNKILKVAFFFVIAIGIYAVMLILGQLGVTGLIMSFFKLIFKFLAILTPFFIGFFIAWLFDPVVKKLSSYKRLNRAISTVLVYGVFIGIIYLFFASAVPVVLKQTNDIVNTMPNIVGSSKNFLENAFNGLRGIEGLDVNALVQNIYTSIENFATGVTTDLPNLIIGFVKNIFSAVGVMLIGLLIGFYMLFDFDHVRGILINLIPKKFREDSAELMEEINTSLRHFVRGILIISTVVFVGTTIGFAIIGLEAPLLFGLFCGVTNVIPYVGPYIGGLPAAVVGFSQGTPTGILVIVVIFVIQTVEGNILQPIIMGKSMKLHPVTIIIGLLVFGNLFGMVGMIFATPILSILKVLYHFIKPRIDFSKISKIFK